MFRVTRLSLGCLSVGIWYISRRERRHPAATRIFTICPFWVCAVYINRGLGTCSSDLPRPATIPFGKTRFEGPAFQSRSIDRPHHRMYSNWFRRIFAPLSYFSGPRSLVAVSFPPIAGNKEQGEEKIGESNSTRRKVVRSTNERKPWKKKNYLNRLRICGGRLRARVAVRSPVVD